jgi:catechol 2,3-dioxygenase-like lactoylglutathione lyase family enzyme
MPLTEAAVIAVRSVDLAVTDLKRALSFFTAVWNLDIAAESHNQAYLRASRPAFHALGLAEAQSVGVVRIWLEASSPFAVDALFARVKEWGAPTDGAPRSFGMPVGGYGFGFQDPEGRNYALVCGANDHVAGPDQPDRPTRLSHVNLNSGANDETFNFMQQALGFTLSDRTRQFRFIRCNSDHHSLVLGFNDKATLNHIAFEMPDLDSVMRGIGRMRDNGFPAEWGPGRHGPGNNVFAYFCGPEELPLEYTAEMHQVDDNYVVRPVEQWGWPPGRLDHWGITPGPSARVKAAQSAFLFTPDGYRLS